jgi:hypothetical protein
VVVVPTACAAAPNPPTKVAAMVATTATRDSDFFIVYSLIDFELFELFGGLEVLNV